MIWTVFGGIVVLCGIGSIGSIAAADMLRSELQTPGVMRCVLALARNSLESEVLEAPYRAYNRHLPDVVTTGRAGVFVTISTGDPPRLRSCWGSVWPTKESLAEEIIAAARGAAGSDPRFDPVGLSELPKLRYTVSIVLEPERVQDFSEIRPAQDGVLVRSGAKQGVALPHEGKTSSYLLEIALAKAGIGAQEEYEVLKFETIRIKEASSDGTKGGERP